MATNVDSITVSKTDNELYLIASTATGSSELVHIKSSYNKPVSDTLYPGAILAAGTYDLTVVGINWGGPWDFNITLNPGNINIGKSSGGANGPVGVVFSQTVQITVKTP